MSWISGVVVLLVTYGIGFCAGIDKISLEVYYESLCPDSENFIVKQLNPTIKAIGNYIDLELIPFGKSSISADGRSMWCQHGQAECTGNRVQDCALQYADSDVLKTEYVTCEMITRAGSRGSFQCVADYNLPVGEVEACFESTTGLSLQLESQRKTQIFKPTFVPTIVINGVFNQSVQDKAFRNLKGTLCEILSEYDPNICA